MDVILMRGYGDDGAVTGTELLHHFTDDCYNERS